jgi:phosphoribosylformimino-5-aminoimidazole carboxamide ribonucleotide (ProFAR) isomerase
MQLIPAIDLMNGKIVRLTRGEAKTAKIYETEFGTPLEAAKRWRDEGAGKLHIIDLDAAFALGNNHAVIAEVAKNVKFPFKSAAEYATTKQPRNSSKQASLKSSLAP